MARASAWATGRAFAYRSMEMEEQAELLCLFHAAKIKEAEEAKGVLLATVGEVVVGLVEAARAAPSAGGRSPGPPPVTPRREGTSKDRVTAQPLPDILRSRLPPDVFSSSGA